MFKDHEYFGRVLVPGDVVTYDVRHGSNVVKTFGVYASIDNDEKIIYRLDYTRFYPKNEFKFGYEVGVDYEYEVYDSITDGFVSFDSKIKKVRVYNPVIKILDYDQLFNSNTVECRIFNCLIINVRKNILRII